MSKTKRAAKKKKGTWGGSRGGGRPKVLTEPYRRQGFSLYLRQIKKLARLAQRAGKNMSEYMRDLIEKL